MNASRTRHHCVAPTPAPSQGDTPRLDTSPATERGSTPPGGSPAGTAADSGQRVSHDQNFKNLIVQYPRQALQFFAPAEAEGIDRRVKITPIRQEQLKPHLTDSFFELDVPLLLEWPDGRREALIFIVEHESDPGRFSITRLASYCLAVAEAMGTTRVIPVVIFMRDGRNIPRSITLGSDRKDYLHFEYIPCVLPQLQAMAHLTTDNVVTALLLPLMHYAREHRVTVYGEAVRSFFRLEQNANRRRKYIDFIDIYADLDEDEQREYAERYTEEGAHMAGMRERFEQLGEQRGIQKGLLKGLEEGRREGRMEGREEGREEGIQLGEERRLRQMLAKLLSGRFGPLDAATEARLQNASLETLDHWSDRILTASTLDEVFRLQ